MTPCPQLHARPSTTQHLGRRCKSLYAVDCRETSVTLRWGSAMLLPVQVWRSQRQLSNPAFRRAAVASYGAAMSAGAQRLVDRWKARRHSGTVDVFRDYNELVRTSPHQ